jgi:hypothetical protein
MIRYRRPVCSAVVLLLSSLVLAPSGAQAAAGWPDLLAQHGFGDSQNGYAWSMAWFKGKLYVGTGRNVLCVEGVTSQFYFRFETIYKTNPAPGVECAPEPYDLDLRAEIWEYTPRTDRWRMVYQSPADIPNPRARGKFLARDIAYRGMEVVRDRRGREALFISGVTSNEYVPENARSYPPRLLRTYDGRRFHNISTPLVVRRTGDYADRRPIGYRGMERVGNRLFVVASTGLTGDGAVFRVRNPFARRARFSQVTPRGMHVFELQRFDGHLYLGTGSFETGYGVYKVRPAGARYRFQPVVTDGAGLGQGMVSVVSMYPFRGHLYVGGVSWYSGLSEKFPEAELIRIGRDDRWEVVTGAPRSGPDGQVRFPISGLPAGFGNMFNAHLWRMVEKDGALYVGTLDWTWLLQDNGDWAGQWKWLVDLVIAGEGGYDLWASCDGVDWFALTRNAFIGDPYDFGVRTLTAGRRGFFIGSANHAFGTRIWHHDASLCGAPGAASRGHAAKAPRRLLTDVQRDGTVISWEPSANAETYRIERAEDVEVPLTLRPPQAAPGAFPTDVALPQPMPSGAPDSFDAQAQLRKPFTTLGTTSRPYFVDRTRQRGTRYAYQVVAEGAHGGASTPSNTQVVPDPRPPATFGQLQDAARAPGAVATISRAYRRGGDRSLARLARLARTARDDRVRQLALRLERRLRYHDMAGGPVKDG